MTEKKRDIPAVLELCRLMLESQCNEILAATTRGLRLIARKCRVHLEDEPIDDWYAIREHYVWKRFDGKPLSLEIRWYPYEGYYKPFLRLNEQIPFIFVGFEKYVGNESAQWMDFLIQSLQSLAHFLPDQASEIARLRKQMERDFRNTHMQNYFMSLTTPQEPVIESLRVRLCHTKTALEAFGTIIFSEASPILVAALKSAAKSRG